MLLELTVVVQPHTGAVGGSVTELSVTWPADTPWADCSGESLEVVLARQWPGHLFTVDNKPLGFFTAGHAPLIDGAVVVAWPLPRSSSGSGPGVAAGSDAALTDVAAPRDAAIQGAAAVLAVSAGPGAGALFALRRGEYSIGRGQCRIHVPDPALSRHHGTLLVSEQGVTLVAARGSAGFALRNVDASPKHVTRQLRGRTKIVQGMAIICGSSVLELRYPDPPVPVGSSARNGTGDPVVPAVDLLDAAALKPLVVPQAPGSAGSRWAMVLAGTLPLILGVVLALTTGSWLFLAFSAVGTVTMLSPVFSGSRRRKTFRAAVSGAAITDAARLATAFPDAAALVLASHSTTPPHPRRQGADSGIALRLGSSSQPANVTVLPDDPAFAPPMLAMVPVAFAVGPTPFCVTGATAAAQSLLRFTLMQLDAAGVPVVMLGPAGQLPLSARFLPHTLLTANAAAAQHMVQHDPNTRTSDAEEPRVLICLDLPVPPWTQNHAKLCVLHFVTGASLGSEPLANGSPASSAVHLMAKGNRMTAVTGERKFLPDGVPEAVFDGYARARSTQEATRLGLEEASSRFRPLGPSTLPPLELCTAEALALQWQDPLGGPLRPVPLGQAATGPAMLDFRRDGPHLLVAGTTGSGKSELLRTLVGNLAALHSPADLQLVFIDFKGGAALGVLTKLPHTSALITDLSGNGVERMLASLRAEMRRRETALAQCEAPDALAYRALAYHPPAGATPLPSMAHLVVVIDEFRVLVDQFPDALSQLLRIAAVGRSLGMHLVMATQRPQGAINADIRANVTSSICLRVQSGIDSSDVIGTGVAADISVSTPGRAFISRAGTAPEEFHSATLGLPPAHSTSLPVVERVAHRLAAACLERGGSSASSSAASDVEGVTDLMQSAWQLLQNAAGAGRRAAPRVVAPELPTSIELPSIAAAAGAETCTAGAPAAGVFLGLMDVPEQQHVQALRWEPEVHSHVACLGTTVQTSAVVALLASQLLIAQTIFRPDHPQTLLYLLDGDGSLAALSNAQWVGSCVAPTDLRTAAHLVSRLAETVPVSKANFVLCISDWGRWVASLRSSPWHDAEDVVGELIRFSHPNLAVVIGGGRELLTATFLAAIPNRAYLTHGSSRESTMLWPTLPRFTPLPARAAVSGPFSAAAPAAAVQGDVLHVAQFATPPVTPSLLFDVQHDRRSPGLDALPGAGPVLRVTALPSRLTAAELELAVAAEPGPPPSRLSMVLGVGGDGGQPVYATLAPGTVLPVLGAPGSGKSSFLFTLAAVNGGSFMQSSHSWTFAEMTGGSLWIDDAAALSDVQLASVSAWLAKGGTAFVSITHPGPAFSRLPLEWGLRSAQQGVVLAPQRPGDAELFGVRLATAGGEPPGRAVLVDRGRSSWFQFPMGPGSAL